MSSSEERKVQTPRLARCSDVEASTVADRVVLYHRTIRTALVLNPMATWLWGLLETPRTADELVNEIRRHFPDVTEERAASDLSTLLDDLVQRGMLTREP